MGFRTNLIWYLDESENGQYNTVYPYLFPLKDREHSELPVELYNIDLAWCHQWIKSSRIFRTLFEYQCVGRFPTYFIVLRSLLALWQKSAIDMSDDANVSGYLRLSFNWLKHKCFFDVLTLQARYLSWIEPALFFAEPGWWEFKSIAGVLYMSSAGTFVEILNWHTASRNINAHISPLAEAARQTY